MADSEANANAARLALKAYRPVHGEYKATRKSIKRLTDLVHAAESDREEARRLRREAIRKLNQATVRLQETQVTLEATIARKRRRVDAINTIGRVYVKTTEEAKVIPELIKDGFTGVIHAAKGSAARNYLDGMSIDCEGMSDGEEAESE